MKKYNIFTSLLLICIGSYVVNYAKQFPKYVNGTPGPGFWPKLLGIVLIALSIALLLTTFFTKKEMKKHLVEFKDEGFRQVFKLFIVMILFGVGLNYIGFLPSSLIFIICVMYIMGARNWKKIILTSVSVTLSIYLIFAVALGLVLPSSKLF